MMEWLKQQHEQNRQRAEVEAMSEPDLDDIDLSRGELMTVATAPEDVLVRQQAMAARFGLDTGDFNEHRHEMVAAVGACAHCKATGECKHYLAGKARPEAVMDFCPNGELYSALSADRRG